MSLRYTFSKKEHLKHRKTISSLFLKNSNFFKFPLKLLYRFSNEISEAPIKVGVSVPKRNFKRAVDRNLIKRRIRESFRLNKNLLYQQLIDSDKSLILMFVYVSKEIEDFDTINNATLKVFNKINAEFNSTS